MTGHALTIPAAAAPQGSKRHVGKGVMIEMSKRVKPYRAIAKRAVEEYIAEVGDFVRLDGPVGVEIQFYFPRPAAARHRPYPHKGGPGDIDKLQRATFDAITDAGLWKDDSQVCRAIVTKLYAARGEEPRVEVYVWEMD